MRIRSGLQAILLMSILVLGLPLFFPGTSLIQTSPAYASNHTVITVWHALPKENSPLFEEMIKEHSNNSHGLFKLDIKRFETPDALHKALLANSEKPDIALIDTRWQEAIVRKSKIHVVEDMLKSKVGSSLMVVMKLDTFEPMWESSRMDGKLISLPFTGYNRALIVNKDILESCKVKETPQVWGDIVKIAKKISPAGSGDNVWPYMIPNSSSSVALADFYEVLMWQSGREVIEPFDNGFISTVDSSESKAVISMLVDFVQKHKIAPDTPVNREKVAMFIGTPADYLSMKDAGINVDVIRWPGNLNPANDFVTYSYLVFDKGQSTANMYNIWSTMYKTVEFKSSSKWGLTTPFLPNNKQVTLSPPYFQYLSRYPGMRVFAAQTRHSRTGVRDELRHRVMTLIGEKLSQGLQGSMTPEQVVTSLSGEINQILDPNGALRARKAGMDTINRYIDNVWDRTLH